MNDDEKIIPFCDQCYGSKFVRVYNITTGRIKNKICPKCDGKGIFYEPPRKEPKDPMEWWGGESIYDFCD